MVLNRSTRLAPLRDVQLLELAKLLRTSPAVVKRLCPDLATPTSGGLRDLMDALDLDLGKRTQRRAQQPVDQASSRPELALAYLRAADKVIQVDDFAA
jgi:acyl-CoA dehydrogenase